LNDTINEITSRQCEEEISVLKSSKQNKVNTKKGRRGSKFRGVSRNGNQWQVLIMVNKKKRYVGSYSFEEEAAKHYDIVALQHHGTRAKTNFFYSQEKIKEILIQDPLLVV
jgi:hypothetical protein